MIYEGIDRWNGASSDQLAHYKYVKKIKIGPFTRYFYSMKDLQAYYKNAKTDRKNTAEAFRQDMATGRAQIGEAWQGLQTGQLVENYPGASRNLKRAYDAAGNFEKTYKSEGKRKLPSLIATGKFALSNIFGVSSKAKAKKRYQNSLSRNKEKFGRKMAKSHNAFSKHLSGVIEGRY